MSKRNSYDQILKSSSIIGGAAGINLLLSMIRVKFVAVLIGAVGVGLSASFTSIQGLIMTISGLGIQSSGVREISVAVAQDSHAALGRTVLTLRRMSWLTGMVGMVITIALSSFFSITTFGHVDYWIEISLLGVAILLANISAGQMALIQGNRRIADSARVSVWSGVLTTPSAILLYYILGTKGIVPSIILATIIQLALTYYFVRQIEVPSALMTWRETFKEARSLVGLGSAFMVSGLMTTGVSYLTLVFITQKEGAEAVGLYTAAFALSGIFVNFVLGAMGTDYFPRLTAANADKKQMNRLVNEQTEIGVLLSLPGLIATMAFAPWILQIFYAPEFVNATVLLQWFVMGCMGRVVSWPLGFVILSLGKGKWYLLTEISANLLHLLLIIIGLSFFGIKGVAIAFSTLYLFYLFTVYFVCVRLTDFAWSFESKKLCLLATLFLLAGLLSSVTLELWLSTASGVFLTFSAGVFCVRSLYARLDDNNRLSKAILALPCSEYFLPRRRERQGN